MSRTVSVHIPWGISWRIGLEEEEDHLWKAVRDLPGGLSTLHFRKGLWTGICHPQPFVFIPLVTSSPAYGTALLKQGSTDRIHLFRRKGEGMQKTSRERVERAARIYASNKEASRALGITLGSFGRLCREYGIETPYERRRKANRHSGTPRRMQERPRMFFTCRMDL